MSSFTPWMIPEEEHKTQEKDKLYIFFFLSEEKEPLPTHCTAKRRILFILHQELLSGACQRNASQKPISVKNKHLCFYRLVSQRTQPCLSL